MRTDFLRKLRGRVKFQKNGHLKLRAIYKFNILILFLIYIALFEYLMLWENQPENANVITAIYWASSTIGTVGYGDVVFHSQIGRIFSVIVQVVGIILISGFLVSYIIIPWMDKVVKFRLLRKAPSGIKEHIIICGYNQLVETLIEELAGQGIEFIVIDEDMELAKELTYKNIPCIYGNSSDRQTLISAGVEKARILIANNSDEKNANIVLTAREFSNLNIIAIVEDRSNSKYLKYAGADTIISPKSIFGHFIGKKAMDRLVSRVTGATEIFEGVHVTEFSVSLKSPLIGKTLKEVASLQIGARVVGIWKKGSLSFDPKENDVIKKNSILLVVGTPEQLSKLKKLTH